MTTTSTEDLGSDTPEPPIQAGINEDADVTQSQPELTSRPHFPIVGIGACAGGLAAFEAFFSAIPKDSETGMAFLLVQHLAPDHKSILSELVKRYTRMRVQEAEVTASGDQLSANTQDIQSSLTIEH